MKNVLVFVDYFLPGFNAGGPIQSIGNMVESLGSEFEFMIVSRDRDLGGKPYKGLHINQWNEFANHVVFYARANVLLGWTIFRLLRKTEYGALYVNSFFSPFFSILPIALMRLGLIKNAPVLLAPRGELAKEALLLKRFKKSLFMRFSYLASFHSKITWHASSIHEKNDIQQFADRLQRAHIAPAIRIAADLHKSASQHRFGRPVKVAGSLKLVTIARIAPIKNHLQAIQILGHLTGNVTLNLYGPIDDAGYWEECEQAIAKLPPGITVRHHGSIQHGAVEKALSENHFFLLLTLGENFGHSIAEALENGCPPIISDRTPWRGLTAKKAGLDLDLADPASIIAEINKLVAVGQADYEQLSLNAKRFIAQSPMTQNALDQNRALFEMTLNSNTAK